MDDEEVVEGGIDDGGFWFVEGFFDGRLILFFEFVVCFVVWGVEGVKVIDVSGVVGFKVYIFKIFV